MDLGNGNRSLAEDGMYSSKYKITIPKHLRSMVNSSYNIQVGLLIKVIPEIAKEQCFALHGGTAINLFHNEMPRLSVDIDLTYIPLEDRQTSLKNINDA